MYMRSPSKAELFSPRANQQMRANWGLTFWADSRRLKASLSTAKEKGVGRAHLQEAQHQEWPGKGKYVRDYIIEIRACMLMIQFESHIDLNRVFFWWVLVKDDRSAPYSMKSDHFVSLQHFHVAPACFCTFDPNSTICAICGFLRGFWSISPKV